MKYNALPQATLLYFNEFQIQEKQKLCGAFFPNNTQKPPFFWEINAYETLQEGIKITEIIQGIWKPC